MFFHTVGISVALVNVYCWVQTTAYDCAGENAKIWNQVILWLQDLPQNTMIIVCTDCNGHVGSHREFDPTLVTADDLGTLNCMDPSRMGEYPHIGPYHPEQENPNGKVFRQFLEQVNLIATNTWTQEASTYTYSHSLGYKTRPDFIAVDCNTWRTRPSIARATKHRRQIELCRADRMIAFSFGLRARPRAVAQSWTPLSPKYN